jgi:hypothetical protein
MAYTKLVFTILGRDDNKYEVYGQGEHAKPERIIHYKLMKSAEVGGTNSTPVYEWKIVNPNMPIPSSPEYGQATNLIWYFSEL